MSAGKAVFLDLNGTLVMPISAESPQDFIELPGARQAVRRLVLAGFICPVITVQSRIAKGIYSQGQFNDWFARFQADWASVGQCYQVLTCAPAASHTEALFVVEDHPDLVGYVAIAMGIPRRTRHVARIVIGVKQTHWGRGSAGNCWIVPSTGHERRVYTGWS
jgi:hypothetical protein